MSEAGAHRSGRARAYTEAALLPTFTFVGAFLMFTLEPMVGRLVLPLYGGAFYVWTTCLMFFQGALLLGYLYAHCAAPRMGRLHLLFLALPLLLLPLRVGSPAGTGEPAVYSLLITLASRVGLPLLVLATTGVLAQSWFARRQGEEKHNPYWLYAASNAGSLGGLLAYPLLVEPWLGLKTQRFLWALLYVVYLLLAAAVVPARRSLASAGSAPAEPLAAAGKLARSRLLYWLCLSAAPSIMLVAVTNAIAFDVGSVPLAWVAPLAVYLLSFVLTFRSRPYRGGWLGRYWPEIGIVGFIAVVSSGLLPSWAAIGWHLLVLLSVCLAGHGELYRARPPARQLTRYYLLIASGGWAGGVFASLAAPLLFERLYEYPVALGLLLLALATGRASELPGLLAIRARRIEGLVRVPVASAALALSFCLVLPSSESRGRRFDLRNHYGIYRVGVTKEPGPTPAGAAAVKLRYLMQNGTVHGRELLVEGGGRMHVGYYHWASGVADALAILERPRRVAMIGLGTGSTASYFDAGEEITFYELDPDDERIAREQFSYLAESPASVRVVIGDARVELANDPQAGRHGYDAIVVDAFSGDSIPVHLLTREALSLYLCKIRADGLLLFHISNRFYDLRPVLRATGRPLGLRGLFKRRSKDQGLEPFEDPSLYMALTKSPRAFSALLQQGWLPADHDPSLPAVSAWSDDYINTLAPLWAKLTANQG